MFKRVRWIGAGAAVGFGASVWAQRKARTWAARYRPSGLVGTAADRARTLPGEMRTSIRDALQEGRDAMAEREAELRRTTWIGERRRARR